MNTKEIVNRNHPKVTSELAIKYLMAQYEESDKLEDELYKKVCNDLEALNQLIEDCTPPTCWAEAMGRQQYIAARNDLLKRIEGKKELECNVQNEGEKND